MVPSLMLVIALAGAAAGAGITRVRIARRRSGNVYFIDGSGNVHTLSDSRREPGPRRQRRTSRT
jgi:hypothetical protein